MNNNNPMMMRNYLSNYQQTNNNVPLPTIKNNQGITLKTVHDNLPKSNI